MPRRPSGKPGGIRAYSDQVLKTSADLDDFDSFAQGRSLAEGWHGAAADAYVRTTQRVAADAEAMSLCPRGVSRAADY